MHLFDDGYEKLRERIFANQKKLGVIPKDAKLEPWPADLITPWDKLTPDAKKLFIRQVEVFAAYAAYSDYEIGRVIQQFDDLGKLDNTLVIYINGDNGTSAEGGPLGTPNEVAFFNGLNKLPVEVQMKFYDLWGTEFTYNHMSAGWSWAFDTPFSWFKQNASKLGGVNQNMVVSWPARIKDKGGLREQFVHVIDVVPTILEAAGLKAPELVDGIPQKPIEGTSFLYSFDAKNAKLPSRHKTQYFEMFGQWALYNEGWLLSTKVNRAPWEAFGPANPDPLNNQVLELYNLNNDFSQTTDLAAQNPQKVKEMKEAFISEAKKYQVFPLDASVAARIVAPRPNITAGRTEFVYTHPMVGLPQGDSPGLLNSSYTVSADIMCRPVALRACCSPLAAASGATASISRTANRCGCGTWLIWSVSSGRGPNRSPLASTSLNLISCIKARGRAPWPSTTSAASAVPAPAPSRWMARWWPLKPWPKPCP
jgi:arylsulfatase